MGFNTGFKGLIFVCFFFFN